MSKGVTILQNSNISKGVTILQNSNISKGVTILQNSKLWKHIIDKKVIGKKSSFSAQHNKDFIPNLLHENKTIHLPTVTYNDIGMM